METYKKNIMQAKYCELIVCGKDDVYNIRISKKQAYELMAANIGLEISMFSITKSGYVSWSVDGALDGCASVAVLDRKL